MILAPNGRGKLLMFELRELDTAAEIFA